MREAKQVRESYSEPADHDDLGRQAIEEEVKDAPAGGDLHGKYQALLDRIKDQDKTINFQKAKIVAL
jgi:hypothetical protein